MYKIGDLILYGGTGVCRIMDVATPDIPGIKKNKLYYVLKPLYQEYVIYSPVDNLKIFMRPIISASEADRLIDMIPTIQAEVYHSRVFSQLEEHYGALLKTHDCSDLLKLITSIYAKKQLMEQQKRKLGAMDVKYMKLAEELLFSELSAAFGISKDKVPDYIAARVNRIVSGVVRFQLEGEDAR